MKIDADANISKQLIDFWRTGSSNSDYKGSESAAARVVDCMMNWMCNFRYVLASQDWTKPHQIAEGTVVESEWRFRMC